MFSESLQDKLQVTRLVAEKQAWGYWYNQINEMLRNRMKRVIVDVNWGAFFEALKKTKKVLSYLAI